VAAEAWQNRYWRNTLSNYLRVLVRMGSGVVLFRLTFQFLDAETFGFYSLLWSLFGFTVLMDFGLGFTVQKVMAEASARGDFRAASRLVATVFWTFTGLAVVVALAAWLGVDAFLRQTQVPAHRHGECRDAFLVFFGFLAAGFPCGLFPEMLRGLQRIDLINWLQIGGGLANLALLGLALVQRWSFPLIMLVSVATSILPSVLAAWLVFPRAPGLSLRPALFHGPSVRGVLSFSIVAYLVTFTNIIMARTDQSVIGFTIGVAFVTVYQAGAKAAEMFNLFAVQLQDAISPAAARLRALGRHDALRQLLIHNTRMTTALVVPLGALCALYLEPLVRLLTGVRAVEPSTLHVGWALLAAGVSQMVTNGVSKRVLMMCGWERKLLWASLTEASANLGLSILLVPRFGVAGVAIGTLIPAVLVGWGWVLPLAARFAGMSRWEFFTAAYLPALRVIGAAAAVLLALAWLAPAGQQVGLLALAWRGVLLGAVTIAAAWPFIRSVRHA
jgi:O-antigen/teichoic acid export membrane protein